MKTSKSILFSLSLLFLPFIVFGKDLTDINSVASRSIQIGNLVIGVSIALAVVWIVVSIVRFVIIGAANEDARKKGRDSIVYGIIGLFVILSIWGLVYILTTTFATKTEAPREKFEDIMLWDPNNPTNDPNLNNNFNNTNNTLWDIPRDVENRNAGSV